MYTESNSPHLKQLSFLAKVFAISLGLSVPSLAFGRAVFGVLFFLSFLCLICLQPWRQIGGCLVQQIKSPIGLLILCTFFLWLPNVLFSVAPVRSLEAVIRTIFFVCLATAVWGALVNDTRTLTLAFKAFIVMTAISVSFCLIATTVLPEIYWILRFQAGKSNLPIGSSLKGFSNLSVLIIPILLGVSLSLKKFWKILTLITVFAFLVFVWQSYNRSALAGFLSIIVLVGLAYSARGINTKAGIYWVIGSVASVTTAIIYLWKSRGSRQELHEIKAQVVQGKLVDPKMLDMSVYESIPAFFLPLWLVDFERQIIWKGAIELGSASPWFGIGANTINYAPGADQFIARTNFLRLIPGHPHNWVVEILAETGIIGLGGLSLVVFFMGIWTVKKWWDKKNLGLIMAFSIMAGYWGSGLFNFSYWSAWWQNAFFLSLSLCFAHASALKNTNYQRI